jgi:hypothetical protein
MKTFLNLLLVSLIYLAGCSSTQQIRYNQAEFDILNWDYEGAIGEIALVDGSTISGKYIQIAEDSTCYREVKSRLNVVRLASDTSRIPTSDITRITYKNTSKGALEGAGFGALAGLAIGAIIANSIEPENSKNPMETWSKGMSQASLIPGGLLAGILIGIPVGSGIGHKDNYILLDSENSVYNEYENVDLQSLTDEDKSPVRVIYSSVVEKGSGYIIILWQGKKIRLRRSEYNQRGTTKEGKLYMVVPDYIYRRRFK